jgi:Spy/CpxP family protein refolding chaperone
MKRSLFGFTFFVCLFNFAFTQVPSDKDGLLKAEGMGQGMTAEMHGYPGPKHVLDLADKLQLTDAQKKSTNQIYTEMSTRAKELGQHIVNLEEELDKAFADKLVVEKSVLDDTEQIGRLRGRLRAVHLNAHLKTKSVLTERQLETYTKLRAGEKK